MRKTVHAVVVISRGRLSMLRNFLRKTVHAVAVLRRKPRPVLQMTNKGHCVHMCETYNFIHVK